MSANADLQSQSDRNGLYITDHYVNVTSFLHSDFTIPISQNQGQVSLSEPRRPFSTSLPAPSSHMGSALSATAPGQWWGGGNLYSIVIIKLQVVQCYQKPCCDGLLGLTVFYSTQLNSTQLSSAQLSSPLRSAQLSSPLSSISSAQLSSALSSQLSSAQLSSAQLNSTQPNAPQCNATQRNSTVFYFTQVSDEEKKKSIPSPGSQVSKLR